MQLPSICCTCDATTSRSLHNITDRVEKYPEKVLADLLKELANIEMPAAFADKLPQSICDKCAGKLNRAYDFVRQARTANELLMGNLEEAPYQLQQPAIEICNVKVELEIDAEEPAIAESAVAVTENPKIDLKSAEPHYYTIKTKIKKKHSKLYNHNPLTIISGNGEYKEAIEKLECSHCGKKYETITSLKAHMRRQEDYIPQIKCDLCDMSFPNSSEFHAHRRQIHSVEKLQLSWPKSKRFNCDMCEKSFIYKSQMKRHRLLHLKNLTTKSRNCTTAVT